VLVPAQLGPQPVNFFHYGIRHKRFIMSGITYRKGHLIFNPNAGRIRRNPDLIEAVKKTLETAGHGVALHPTSGPGDATRLATRAVQEGADVVLAAGGDGTINEVVNGMVGSAIPLGALPAGTANVLGMETRMGGDPVKAALRLAELEPVRIALGLVREIGGQPRRHFLLMAGAGVDARIIVILNPRMKKLFGKGAYWLAGGQSLFRRLEELDAQISAERRRCSFALASRVRNYGGDLEIATGASLLKEPFELVLFEGANPLRYFKYFAGVLARRAGRVQGVTVASTRCVALTPLPGQTVYIQVDGEQAGTLPAQVEIVPGALTLLVPPEFLEKERSRWTT
jgi:diacylglycerol kinase family enzyme